jgi:hypothetical protein
MAERVSSLNGGHTCSALRLKRRRGVAKSKNFANGRSEDGLGRVDRSDPTDTGPSAWLTGFCLHGEEGYQSRQIVRTTLPNGRFSTR